MSSYQVLFSGEVSRNANEKNVREKVARELGIDLRKAKQLFSGRTVVLKSQLSYADAQALMARFAKLGAICRVKDISPKQDKDAVRVSRADRERADHTLQDITAAHVECPRCAHMQLQASHCTRCGIDIEQAIITKQKEDQMIQRQIHDLKGGGTGRFGSGSQDKKRGVKGWLKRSF